MRHAASCTLLFCLLALLLFCPALAQDEDLGVLQLIPVACEPDAQAGQVDLYFGPTQGYLHEEGLTLDLSASYVCFGQADCWAMVAAGTPDAFGPVGWVEAAAAQFPEEPLLAFEDALPVMVEEDAGLIANPMSDAPTILFTVPRGTQVILLAYWDEWGYVQTDVHDTPVRAFLPLQTIL